MTKDFFKMIVGIVVFGGLASPIPALAADYYVCFSAAECNAGSGSGWATGSPNNDGLSRSSPLQCPKDLVGKLQPGSSAVIGDGAYSWSRCNGSNSIFRPTNVKGTADQPIIISAENKWGAVFDGEEVIKDDAARSRKLVLFEYTSHLELHGIELMRGKSGIEFYAGRINSFITLKELKMHDFSFVAISTQITDHDVTIDSTISYDIWDDSNYDQNHTCVHQHNMYLQGYNITVLNNVLHSSYGGTALTIGGFCNTDGVTQDPAGFTHTIHAINNTIDGNGCVVSYTEPNGDKRFNTVDFFNRTLHSGAYCSNIAGGAKKRNFKNVAFENNLFLNGQTARAANGEFAQAIGNTNSETVYATPNCYDFPWWSPTCENSILGTAGYIRFNNNVSETYVQNPTHQVWADEYSNNCDNCSGINLRGVLNNDYMPTVNSIALIGKGSSESAPDYDILGRPRPSDSVDVGAYQYSTGGPTPEPPVFR